MGTTLLVGRERECAVIEDAVRGLADGRPRLIEVEGARGIGKTTILHRLAQAGSEAAVLRGSAAEFEQDSPFALIAATLQEYLHGTHDGLWADLAPDLAELVPGASTTTPVDRARIHRAVRTLVGRIAARHDALLLVLDDVHWIDAASAQLLAAFVRRPVSAPVLLAVAHRPGRLPAVLAGELARAHSAGWTVQRLTLSPLDDHSCSLLLGAEGVPPGERTELIRLSEGNPFFLVELARAPGRGVDAAGGAGAPPPGVPPAVAAALAGEVATLSADARAFLDAAAVVGEPFEAELPATVARLEPDRATAAVDEVLRRGLAEPTELGGRFRFRHPLVRAALYAAVPGGTRIGLHRRAVEVLTGQGAPATARAHHVEHSAQTGDEQAIAVLSEAARATLPSSPAIAAHWCAVAVGLLPDPDAVDESVARLHAAHGAALQQAGRTEQSHAALLRALASTPSSAAQLQMELAGLCAQVESLLGQIDAAQRRLADVLARTGGERSPAAVPLLLGLAAVGAGRPDDGLTARYCHLVLARPDLAPLDRAYALAMLAMVSAIGNRAAEAEPCYREARDLLPGVSNAELDQRPAVLYFLGFAAACLGRNLEADELLRRAERLLPDRGDAHIVTGVRAVRTVVLRRLARIGEALAVADDAVESAHDSGTPRALMMALFTSATALIEAGRPGDALVAAERAAELAREHDPSSIVASVGLALGSALQALGRPQEAVAAMAELMGGPTLADFLPHERPSAFEVLVLAELDRGDLDAAREVIGQAALAVAGDALPPGRAALLRSEAALALAEGRPDLALARASAAGQLSRELGAVLDEARSLILAARARIAAGHRDAAAADLRAALALLDGSGAARWQRAAEEQLRRIGRRRNPPGGRVRRGGTGLELLTSREREVAELVLAGRTNREIAERLVLSPKTVENHVGSVLRRLDVASRRELVSRYGDRGRGEHAADVAAPSG